MAQPRSRSSRQLSPDFCHEINVPPQITPLGGLCEGKRAVLQRLQTIAESFEIVSFDTSKLLVERDRAAVRIPLCYRHRQSGTTLETTIGCFWELEEGWPANVVEYHDVERLRRFFESLQEEA